MFMTLWLQTAETVPELGQTSHLRRLNTCLCRISPQFSSLPKGRSRFPLDGEKASVHRPGKRFPKQQGHRECNFLSGIWAQTQLNHKSLRKPCIRDETKTSVLLPVLHKDLIHHFFSPLLESYQGFQCIFITYRHHSS